MKQRGGRADPPMRDGATVHKTVAQSSLTLITVQPSLAAWSSACSAPLV
jgi:hypothetical protein